MLDKTNQLLKTKRSKKQTKKKETPQSETTFEFAKPEQYVIITKHLLNDSVGFKQIISSNKNANFLLDTNISEFPVLKYDIDSWSSFTQNHHPKNIMVDDRENPLSRWSVQSRSQNEFVIMKLEKTSVLMSIVFGKYKESKESNPNNLKEFKVYVGLEKDSLSEVLNAGMSSDNDYEDFPVCHFKDDCYIPCK